MLLFCEKKKVYRVTYFLFPQSKRSAHRACTQAMDRKEPRQLDYGYSYSHSKLPSLFQVNSEACSANDGTKHQRATTVVSPGELTIGPLVVRNHCTRETQKCSPFFTVIKRVCHAVTLVHEGGLACGWLPCLHT